MMGDNVLQVKQNHKIAKKKETMFLNEINAAVIQYSKQQLYGSKN
jgi:hypothetical protein